MQTMRPTRVNFQNVQTTHTTQYQRNKPIEKWASRSSSCGTTGSVISLQHQDVGLIPGLARWIKGPDVATAAA